MGHIQNRLGLRKTISVITLTIIVAAGVNFILPSDQGELVASTEQSVDQLGPVATDDGDHVEGIGSKPELDFFVDNSNPAASDDIGNGSLEQPWKTLAYAFLQLQPGETLFIRGGTYNNAEIRLTDENSGSEYAPITVKPYPGEVATLRDGEPIRFYGTDWWIIEGLKFINVPRIQFGVHEDLGYGFTDPAEHIIIRNCEFGNAEATTLSINYGNDLLFENNYFHHIRIGVSFSKSGREANALVLRYITDNIRIINNRFEDIGSDGVHVNPEGRSGSDIGSVEISGNEFWVNRPYDGILGNVGENGIDVKKCRGPVVISDNVIHGFRPTTSEQDASGAHGPGLTIHGEARNLIVERNLFYDNTSHINITKGVGTGPADIMIRNNIFLETMSSDLGGYQIDGSALQVKSAANVQVYHNTFVNNNIYLISNNTLRSIFKNNIVIGGWANVQLSNADWEADYNAWSQITGPLPVVLKGTNDLNVEDLGLDENLRPISGSPVIGEGKYVGVSDDFNSESRGNHPDIGAIEHNFD